MNPSHVFFATTARGMREWLGDELRTLGARRVVPKSLGVRFEGPLEMGYRVCLWSRIASRVLLRISSFPIEDAHSLYAGVRSIPWEEHFGLDDTFAVHAVGHHPNLKHTGYIALKTKDAIVDRFRNTLGSRPSVDTKDPRLRIHVSVGRHNATVSLDLSGESLHRRGYRHLPTPAPLKETLAATVLVSARWPEIARAGGILLDPLCGSGTLLIESAWMAADMAPGLCRRRFGFEHWLGHDAPTWNRLLEEARRRIQSDRLSKPIIYGFDADAEAVRIAREHAAKAGVEGMVAIDVGRLKDCRPPTVSEDVATKGLFVTNPPYGERLGEVANLIGLYATMGDILQKHFAGWTAYVLTGNRKLARSIGLRLQGETILYNGAIQCLLCRFELPDPNAV